MSIGRSSPDKRTAPDISGHFGQTEQVLLTVEANSADIAMDNNTKGDGWAYLTDIHFWFVVEGDRDPSVCVPIKEIRGLGTKFVGLPGMRIVTFSTSRGERYCYAMGKKFVKTLKYSVEPT